MTESVALQPTKPREWRSSINCAIIAPSNRRSAPNDTMPVLADLLKTIETSTDGMTLSALLAKHPDLARRTAQRWIGQLALDGRIVAVGAGRARRYLASETAVRVIAAGMGAGVTRWTSNPFTMKSNTRIVSISGRTLSRRRMEVSPRGTAITKIRFC